MQHSDISRAHRSSPGARVSGAAAGGAVQRPTRRGAAATAPDLPRLTRCLQPATIAVIGGDEAAQVIRQCRRLGYRGALWPVNPRRGTMAGIRCYPRIDDLPEAPDAAFIAIPAEATIAAVAALAARGAGGAVCYASGFKEVGADGARRQRRLLAAAQEMPIIGPNCYGFLNLTCGAALWPDYHAAAPLARGAPGVAVFSQSGNVSLNLTMQRRLLPLAWLVTLGNQAQVGIEEGMAAALASPRIRAIGIHLEGLRDVAGFAAVVHAARAQRVPVVALKVGRSAAGARLTRSHTATLAGAPALYDALFARLGVAQVETPEEFVEALKLLCVHGPLTTNRIASMSCSGGEATLVADLGAARGLRFPAPKAPGRRALRAALGAWVHIGNPLDYHTFIWGDRAALAAAFRAMLAGDFALTLLILDYPGEESADTRAWGVAVAAFVEACSGGARGALVASLSENLPEAVGRRLLAHGIVPLQGLAQALTAVAAAVDIGGHWARAAPPPLARPAPMPRGGRRSLDEYAAKSHLAAAGLPVAPGEAVSSAAAAVAAADRLGYPVVLKALGADLVHKTEQGGVMLGLGGADEVRRGADRMLGVSGRLLVEKMVEGAVAELLLGIGWAPPMGHYLIIGSGGVRVELLRDRQLLLLPARRAMIAAALGRLRLAPLLDGHRGAPAADRAAVVDCAMALVRWLDAHRERVWEAEINPLLVLPAGRGVVVADALMTVRE